MLMKSLFLSLCLEMVDTDDYEGIGENLEC